MATVASRLLGELQRSFDLFQGFRHEADEPEAFYRLLADDTVKTVASVCTLTGARFVDVGGGPGYVSEAFRAAGTVPLTVEYDYREATLHGRTFTDGIIGDGQRLPLRTAAVDVAYTSNVIEHVPDPRQMLCELVRIVRPGGVIYVTFTNWYSPWGGHETSPWHYFGGEYAARRYERRYGRPPKNRYGTSLFKLHVGEMLRWVHASPSVELIDASPRYYPRFTRAVLAVPGLREVATWNLAMQLRRR
jgi:SAM-dependent methyltransferase